jgi:hypothetical protein
MKIFRFFIAFAMLFLSTNSLLAQIYNYKATSVSVLERNEKGAWGKWSEFKKSPVLITFNANKDRFIINSRDIQLYKITAYMEKVSTENDDILGFQCEDMEGATCMLMIVTRKKEKNRLQFYINYSDLKLVYNIYEIE